MKIRTWVHACTTRSEKHGPTIESLDDSDLKGRYELIECPSWKDVGIPAINKWWCDTMVRLATEPFEGGSPPDFVVRLEDDVVVNKHILHNIETWPSLQENDFGMGLIFNWDCLWPPLPQMQRWRKNGCLIRLDVDIACAQGQVFRADFIPSLVRRIPKSQTWFPPWHVVFDHVATRATRLAGKYVHVHLPSLVNCHRGCHVGVGGDRRPGNYSNKTFHPTWKRGRDPDPRRL
jgi:hypothetical protein